MQLERVQLGWKALGNIINKIVDSINSNCPVEGSGIRIVDTSSGKIIEVSSDQGNSTIGGGKSSSGGGGTPMQVIVFDSSGNPISLTVMTDGSGVGSAGLTWQPVDVVTPPGCVPTTISVLTK